jgi:hypothetical protein
MDKLCDFNLSIGGIRNKMKFYDLELFFFKKMEIFIRFRTKV